MVLSLLFIPPCRTLGSMLNNTTLFSVSMISHPLMATPIYLPLLSVNLHLPSYYLASLLLFPPLTFLPQPFLVSFSCTTEYLSSRFSSKLLIQNFDLPSIPLRTVATLRKHGITTSCVGRKLKASDFDQFDYIFGMDDSNVSNIKRVQPAGSKAQVKLFSFW